jgi:hypothetical protein
MGKIYMEKCTKCSDDIYDFEEIKYGLCWECISKDNSIIENDSSIGEIDDNETINVEHNGKYSLNIRSSDGSKLTLCSEELNKSNMSDDKTSKSKKATTISKKTSDKKADKDIVEAPIEDKPPVEPVKKGDKPPVEPAKKEDKPTTEPAGKPAPKDEEDDEQQLIRESKEILTKSARAKTRAFALINQAMKETGEFEVSAIADGKRMTVASAPYKDKNFEDILMTTTMEVIDSSITTNRSKKK